MAEFNYLNKDSPLLDPWGQITFVFTMLLPRIDRGNILESLQTWGLLHIWLGWVTSSVIPPFLGWAMPDMFKDWAERGAKERQQKKRKQDEKEMEKTQSDAEGSTAGEPREVTGLDARHTIA